MTEQEFLTSSRADREIFCILRERLILLIDDTCFSRARDCKCALCIHDRNRLTVDLIWCLTDIIEDSKEAS